MICASLNFEVFIRILLGLICRKNSTFEHHFFAGGLPIIHLFHPVFYGFRPCHRRLEKLVSPVNEKPFCYVSEPLAIVSDAIRQPLKSPRFHYAVLGVS